MGGDMAQEAQVCVGIIAGAFGVRGEVRLKSYCSTPEAIADYGPLHTEDRSKSFHVTLARSLTGGFAARLSGVTDKEQADALRGTQLYAPRAAFPELVEDEYYHADLIGLAVHDTGGAVLGTVQAIHNHGAGDLLEVFCAGRKQALLLPFTRQIVPTIDLKAGCVVADIPEGLE